MKVKQISIPLTVYSLILSFQSCKLLKAFLKSTQPSIQVQKIQVDSLTLSDISLSAYIKVTNPAQLPVVIPTLSFQFQVEGNVLSEGTLRNVKTSTSPQFTIQIPFSISWRDIYNAIKTIHRKDSFNYLFKGTINLNVGSSTQLSIPFSHSGTLPMLKPLKISVSAVQVSSVSIQSLQIQASILILNNNSFPAVIKNLNYSFKAGNLSPVNISSATNVTIPPHSTKSIPVTLSVDLAQAGQAALSILNQKQLPYSFKGNTHIEIPDFAGKQVVFNMPFTSTGTLNIK